MTLVNFLVQKENAHAPLDKLEKRIYHVELACTLGLMCGSGEVARDIFIYFFQNMARRKMENEEKSLSSIAPGYRGMPREPIYTSGVAAQWLGVSISTVHRLVKAGKLPAYVPGTKQLRFKQVDLEHYLTAREVQNGEK